MWAIGLRYSVLLIGVARTVILARLLGPSDYGIFSIALLFVGISEVLTRGGFSHSIIRIDKLDSETMHSLWTADLLRGALIAVATFFAAPLAQIIFNAPHAVLAVRLMSLHALLIGARNVKLTLALRDVMLGRVVAVEGIGVLVGMLVAVLLAYLVGDFRALVFAYLAQALAQLASSYILLRGRLVVRLNWKLIRPQLRFGMGIWLEGIATYARTSIARVFLGITLGADSLGFFDRGNRLASYPTVELHHAVNRVLFPSLSRVRNSEISMARGYERIVVIMLVLQLSIVSFLVAFAHPAIALILGEKWLTAVPAFQLLLVWGTISTISQLAISLFRGLGDPHLSAVVAAVGTVVTVPLLYALRVFGSAGAAAAMLVAAFTESALVLFILRMRTELPILRTALEFFLPFVAAAVASVIAAANISHFHLTPFLTLALGGILTVVLFVVELIVIGKWVLPRFGSHLIWLLGMFRKGFRFILPGEGNT